LWNHPHDIPLGIANGMVIVERQGTEWSVNAVSGEDGKTHGNHSTGLGQPAGLAEPGAWRLSQQLCMCSSQKRLSMVRPSHPTSPRCASPTARNFGGNGVITVGSEFIYLQAYTQHYLCTYRRSDGTAISCTGDLGIGRTLAIVNGAVYVSRETEDAPYMYLQIGKLDASGDRVRWYWRSQALPGGVAQVQFQWDTVIVATQRGVYA
jgi:hypothetical protein